MAKTLGVATILCICSINLSAQNEFPPLPSTSTVWYTIPVSPPSTCKCFKKEKASKVKPAFYFDIPISPFWDNASIDRIRNKTIQFGGSATPMKEAVISGGWPVPRFSFSASGFRTQLEGGEIKLLDGNLSRTMDQVGVFAEGDVFHVLIGANGFFGQELIPGGLKGVKFDADFKRRSYGGNGWLGLKFGDFRKNFIAGRYGMGYARTKGFARFNIPGAGDLDEFLIYFEDFKTKSFSVEGKATSKVVSQSASFNRMEYERVDPSPDPLRFGENHLEDMWFRTETEVAPFGQARFLRGVLVLTKDFRDQNRLMFTNDYSSVRILLRIAF